MAQMQPRSGTAMITVVFLVFLASLLGAAPGALGSSHGSHELVASQIGTAPVEVQVAVAPSRGLGEATVATGKLGMVVTATSFSSGGPSSPEGTSIVDAWGRPRGQSGFDGPFPLLPNGFSRSYDSASTSLPNGTLLVVAGSATDQRGRCIPGGSVFLAQSTNGGASFSPPLLLWAGSSTVGFADRPTVAAGHDGTVWVAWSQGPPQDACELVGNHDAIAIEASRNGRTFSAPVVVSAPAAAFGASVVPLGHRRALVAWVQAGPSDMAFLMARVVELAHDQVVPVSAPYVGGRGVALPLLLPEAHFYSFDAAYCTLVSREEVACAWTTWDPERKASSVQIDVLAPLDTPSLVASLQGTPAPGNDLLLGALALQARALRLLCADFDPATGSITYESAPLVDGPSGWVFASPLGSVGPASPDTSYYEVGEVSWMSSYQNSATGAFVSASDSSASLDLVEWKAPAPSVARAQVPSATSQSPQRRPSVSRSPRRGTRGDSGGGKWWPEAMAAVVILAGAAMLARHTKRRRRRRRKAALIGAVPPKGPPRQRWE